MILYFDPADAGRFVRNLVCPRCGSPVGVFDAVDVDFVHPLPPCGVVDEALRGSVVVHATSFAVGDAVRCRFEGRVVDGMVDIVQARAKGVVNPLGLPDVRVRVGRRAVWSSVSELEKLR